MATVVDMTEHDLPPPPLPPHGYSFSQGKSVAASTRSARRENIKKLDPIEENTPSANRTSTKAYEQYRTDYLEGNGTDVSTYCFGFFPSQWAGLAFSIVVRNIFSASSSVRAFCRLLVVCAFSRFWYFVWLKLFPRVFSSIGSSFLIFSLLADRVEAATDLPCENE